MPTDAHLSHTRGVTDPPLLTETIGANLARTVAAFGEREALVDVPAGRRWTYRELAADVAVVALGLLARACVPATGSASGHRTARSGCCCSTRRRGSARSW